MAMFTGKNLSFLLGKSQIDFLYHLYGENVIKNLSF